MAVLQVLQTKMKAISRFLFCAIIAGGLTVLPLCSEAKAPVKHKKKSYLLVSAQITGFDLSSCGDVHCFTVKADTAVVGMYGGNYAFDEAKITIIDRKTGQTQVLDSKDAYYDMISKKIFMRDVVNNHDAEAIYDLQSEKLSIYPTTQKI